MSYLARKITRAKWDARGDFAAGEIPADAVTADLRTSGNTLSFWKLELLGNDEICRTALALATAAERIDPMDLVWVHEEIVTANGIILNPSAGRTPVAALREDHVDMEKLDLDRLSSVATFIRDALALDQHKRFTRTELIGVIAEAVSNDLLSLDDLQPKVRKEIEKRLSN